MAKLKKKVKRKSSEGNKEYSFDRSIVKIDEEDLVKECLHHPSNVSDVAIALADAVRDRDSKKMELEVLEAELDLEIRKNPDKFNLPKVTESTVRSALVSQGVYQGVKEELLEANHTVDVLKGLSQALMDKRKSLENLVQLHGMDYFSSPNLSKSSYSAIESAAEDSVMSKSRSYKPKKRSK